MDLIAAIGSNRELGYMNGLPWPTVKADMAHFKKYTLDKAIIMGSSTFKSLGKPLPGRHNIVLSSKDTFDGVCNVRSIQCAVDAARLYDEVVVIGGANVYSQFMPYVDKLVITEISGTWVADTYFPDVFAEWKISKEEILEKGVTVRTYVRL